MNNTVIQVHSLSKRYRIGRQEKRHDTFAGQLLSTLKAPIENFRQLRSLSRFDKEDESVFWALKDINFDVQQGEVLGIIGHNGAGKSTLLKILSRITEPTSGEIRVKGRVSALLEVGTGFHPELTGRENVYMNGTILGMTKREIDTKFDEIVDFSGVEKYIDTPVKFYSSGMKVRLGFAVAAHLEPEILIIDEVLAVGDAEFQRKCLGKMEEVSKTGRTVLFVSHNMGAVRNLCNRGIVLNHGRIQFAGSVDEATKHYVEKLAGQMNAEISWRLNEAPGDHRFKVLSVKVRPTKGDIISIDSGVAIECEIVNYEFTDSLIDMSFELSNSEGMKLIHHGGMIAERKEVQKGKYLIRAEIPSRILNRGIYMVKVWFGLNQRENLINRGIFLSFEILNAHIDHISRELPGSLRPEIKYKSSFLGHEAISSIN